METTARADVAAAAADIGAEFTAPTTPAEAAASDAIPDVATVFEISDTATATAVVARLLAMDPTTIHACDTEVADIDVKKSPLGQGRVTCVSLYSGPDADYGRGPGQALWIDTSDEAVLHAFRPFLESEKCLKAWHNYAFDRHVLWNHGVDVQGFGGDTMHMARLWDASRIEGYSLAVLTEELVSRQASLRAAPCCCIARLRSPLALASLLLLLRSSLALASLLLLLRSSLA